MSSEESSNSDVWSDDEDSTSLDWTVTLLPVADTATGILRSLPGIKPKKLNFKIEFLIRDALDWQLRAIKRGIRRYFCFLAPRIYSWEGLELFETVLRQSNVYLRSVHRDPVTTEEISRVYHFGESLLSDRLGKVTAGILLFHRLPKVDTDMEWLNGLRCPTCRSTACPLRKHADLLQSCLVDALKELSVEDELIHDYNLHHKSCALFMESINPHVGEGAEWPGIICLRRQVAKYYSDSPPE